jgi:ribonucleotide reductase alpha subunit
MNDEEKLEKMYKELFEQRKELRKNQSITQSIKPSGSTSLYSNISGGVNFDFASLYPSKFTMNLLSRKVKRMNKIIKIFSL